MKSRLKEFLVGSRLFIPARSVYRRLFQRRQNAEHSRMRLFYSQFFASGDLVFDVGANQGEYAEIFALNGARVIAIEPNPAFRSRLEKLTKIRSIVPEFCAAGDVEGSATLNVCSQSGFSTLQPEMIEWSKDSPDYRDVQWTSRVTVPIVTLKTLAERHGFPVFVKIDVEGFEYQVISGMSFNPRFVSFEFGARHKQSALQCISDLGRRGYRFNPIIGRVFAFDFERWISAQEATDWLTKYSVDRGEYGDMFARLESEDPH
jgi:FkbM family methyltransferase